MRRMRLALFLAILWTAAMGLEALEAGDHPGRDPLLDKLIDKGVITEEEAKAIEKEEETLKGKSAKEADKTWSLPKGLKGIQVGMLAYVDYSNGKDPQINDGESSFNEFRLNRGYLTVKKEVLPWMHARITIDAHQDETGDYKNRLKYLYAELRPPDWRLFTSMKSEIGLGHIPWLDFEEHINPYRCQGTMAVERAGTFNSADEGVSLRGYLGGHLEDAEEKTGSHYYDGRYGSWHLGVYDGAGYHASEENNNKVLEGRLTLRPVPDRIPGLQVSYFGIHGEGNKEAANGDYPDYNVNLGMLSYQYPSGTFTAQYFQTEGNAKGSWVDGQGDALETAGYSFFGNYRLPVMDRKLSLFARYDHFDQDKDDAIADDTDYSMIMGGLAWNVYKHNLLMLVYETTDYDDDAGTKGSVPQADNNLGDDQKIQAVWQIKF